MYSFVLEESKALGAFWSSEVKGKIALVILLLPGILLCSLIVIMKTTTKTIILLATNT